MLILSKKLEYFYPMTKKEHKVIQDKHIIKYVRTGGFSISALFRMLVLYLTLFIDILLFLNPSDFSIFDYGKKGYIFVYVLCALNVLLLYSGKFLYVNKEIFKRRKDRDKIIDLFDAKYYVCRGDFVEYSCDEENVCLILKVDRKKNLELNVLTIASNKIKKFCKDMELAVFIFEQDGAFYVYDVMQFKVFEKALLKKGFFKRFKKTRVPNVDKQVTDIMSNFNK